MRLVCILFTLLGTVAAFPCLASTSQVLKTHIPLQRDYPDTDATRNDATYQMELAFSYYWGKNAPLDYTESLKRFRRAAQLGNPDAQFAMGLMCARGEGTQQDYGRAKKWYALAAHNGNALAQFQLGALYDEGLGIPSNPKKAAQWYYISAVNGNTQAHFNLALLYHFGHGVVKNARLAEMHYILAEGGGKSSLRHVLAKLALELGMPNEERLKANHYAKRWCSQHPKCPKT